MKKLTKKDVFNMVQDDYMILYRPMPDEIKSLFPVITVKDCKGFGLHLTVDHTGKMSGMVSLSTTCKCNEYCIRRIRLAVEAIVGYELADSGETIRTAIRKYISENPMSQDVSICAFCFSDAKQNYMTSMTAPLSRNHEILNNGIIHPDWLPTLNVLFFRGESFGDFASVNAVINFYNLAAKNPAVHVTPWTKNLAFFGIARDKYGAVKPDNLTLVYSSQYINKRATVSKKHADLVDVVFTVYTPEYADAHNIAINCGARSCLACLRCYLIDKQNGKPVEVAELLK